MKKVIFSFAFLAALLAGCQRPELVEQVDAPTFLADVEEFGSRTKTSMTSERKVIWTKNDRVAIFHKSTQAREYVLVDDYAGGSNGKFNVALSGGTSDNSSVVGDELPCNVALYPYADGLALEVGVNDDVASYTISNVNLPAIQNYAPNSFGGGAFPMAAVTGSVDDRNLKFKNVLGVLKLSLKGTQTVMSIMVEGKNGELLSGAAEILLLSTNSNPQITMTSEDQESHYVTLDCGEGVHLSNAVATDFYITLPPATYTEGFKVTVTDSDSETHVFEATTSNTVIRSSILVMPEISLGGSDEDHPGGEDSSSENDYVDEYGINHGPGVEIDGVVWAPVNCGYHATDYKWGKLYQWGRKYGQGYQGPVRDGDDNAICWITEDEIPEISEGPVYFEEGQSYSNHNVFYTGSQDTNYYWWIYPQRYSLWNTGSEEHPTKTIYDPCPKGWRVPNETELNGLILNASDWTINDSGLSGRWFSGSRDYSSEVPQVFLPAAGLRDSWFGECSSRGYCGQYRTSGHCDVIYLNQDEFRATVSNLADGVSVRCVKNSTQGGNQEDEVLALPVMSAELNASSLNLHKGETYQLKLSVIPNYIIDKPIWSSNKSLVASVDENGLVTALTPGTAKITVYVGGVPYSKGNIILNCTIEICNSNYVDEYGINHGHGVEVGGSVWAPVNCGYKAPIIGDAGFVIDAGYPYGKLYQWGRKYGQGYSGYLYGADGSVVGEVSDHTVPAINDKFIDTDRSEIVNVFMSEIQSESNANEFYLGLNLTEGWSGHRSTKADCDPCPNGWRVPTHSELAMLFKNHSSWTTNDAGQIGYWFSGNIEYSETSAQIFLPAAGYRDLNNGIADDRGLSGSYWSGCGWENSNTIPNKYMGHQVYVFTSTASTNTELGGFTFEKQNGYSVRCVQD